MDTAVGMATFDGQDRRRVTDSLAELIAEHDVRVMYSCGPMPMLEALSTIAVQSDITHQCAVEESMACGIGVCMTCVIPMRTEDGLVKMMRSCIDGPVVDGARVVWNVPRTIPEGTWGS